MMRYTGIVRRIDGLGRLTLPSELRNKFNLEIKDFVEIFVENGCIIIRKYVPTDIFNGSSDELIEYHGKKVSKKSIIEMAEIAGLEFKS